MNVMNLKERINSFTILGEVLLNALDGKGGKQEEKLNALMNNQHLHNPWFTPDNVRMAVRAIASELTRENLEKWTGSYPALEEKMRPYIVGLIMAGNIPLAGFHDFLSVLISGNKLIAKTSSKDSELIVHISEILCSINGDFRDRIEFTEETLSKFDVVIATGSNNSARYFDYYFGKYPNIIRKNRNGVAVIEGNETDKEFESLGIDIFSYFGLGCRNVSKIFVPHRFDFNSMISNWKSYSNIISHTKYANNYDFNMAVFLVNKDIFIDTGFVLLKEDPGFSSPVAVLFYEYYDSLHLLDKHLSLFRDRIQCIVGKRWIPFGKAQSPKLWDYSDDIDTLDFLLKKNEAGIL